MERSMTHSDGSAGPPEKTDSNRSGSKILIIPPELMRLALTQHCNLAASEGAGVYLAGVMEYLIAEMLDTAVTNSPPSPGRLETGHILDTLLRDAELKQVFPPLGEAPYKGQGDRSETNEASYYDVVKDAARSVLLQTKRVFSFTQGNLG